MTESNGLRTALFVDFDNIFLGLRRTSEGSEVRFAEDPARWVRWLEERLEPPYVGSNGRSSHRRILLRRCYLNPRSFHRSRPFFIRAGFEVVDTPPLTMNGKTSADVFMALDMIEALNHDTRFDEFIVFSGDADFRPVLLRLRAHDRRTVVLSTGNVSAAYRNASDHVIEEDEFLEQALGVSEPEARRGPPPRRNGHGSERATPDLLRQIAGRVQELASMTGGVFAHQLPSVYKEFPAFLSSDSWLGYYSLRALTEAVVETRRDLALSEDEPWRVVLLDGKVTEPAGPQSEGGWTSREEGEAVADFVRETVEASDQPVVLATLAHGVSREFGEEIRSTNWRGAGSFSRFLHSLSLEPVALSSVIPGYAYIPGQHPEPTEESKRDDSFAQERPELAAFAKNLHDLTDMPYLSPEGYATVVQEIAKEVREHGFHLTRTSKAVRDHCLGKGLIVSRSAVSFLLKGLLYDNFRFESDGSTTPDLLAHALADNALTLAERAQMNVSPDQEALVREWIVGGL